MIEKSLSSLGNVRSIFDMYLDSRRKKFEAGGSTNKDKIDELEMTLSLLTGLRNSLPYEALDLSEKIQKELDKLKYQK
jgi:hypothetical protein